MTVSEGYVLGIAGSPRRHGNSEQLLEACLEGAREAGAPVRLLVAGEAAVAPCRGCNACSLTGECVVRDSMRDVYPLLDAAAAIVVSTPVYFATVPAVLKSVIDRCQPYWARRYVLKQPPSAKRPGGALIVRGGGDPYGYKCAATAVKSVYAVLRVSYDHELAVEGPDSPSDIGRRPEALAEARAMGASLAREAGFGIG